MTPAKSAAARYAPIVSDNPVARFGEVVEFAVQQHDIGRLSGLRCMHALEFGWPDRFEFAPDQVSCMQDGVAHQHPRLTSRTLRSSRPC